MKKEPTVERFWRFVDKSKACWIWTGSKTSAGYGKIWDNRTELAHRFSYKLAFGPIPKGLYVCHHCDNPSCVNPEHLFIGTNSDNLRDLVNKGKFHPATGEAHGSARLTSEEVRRIRNETMTARAAAALFGISERHVRGIRQGKTWRTI